MKSTRDNHRYLFPISVVVVLAAWETLPRLFAIPPYVFPIFSRVITRTFVESLDVVARNTVVTIGEAVGGFLVGSAVGFLIGLTMGQSRVLRNITLPYIVASNSIPVVALAPLAIVWFGSGVGSKVAVAAFVCFFPLAMNTFKGLREYSSLYKDLFDLYGASQSQFLGIFKLPHAVSYIFTGMKLNAVYAVLGAIVAEFIGADRGIGFGMLQATYGLDSARLWGYILIACALGMTFYGLIVLLERYVQARRSHS